MKLSCCPFRSSRVGVWCMVVGTILWTTACKNPFVPKHKVIVDAIAAPDAPKPTGKSFRLVTKRSSVSNTPVQIPVLKACVDAALVSHGLYESPSTVAPELVIEVSYGRDASPRAMAAVRETYLQLSARSNPQRAIDKATGPELWDVRVAVLGVSGAMETALPLLSAVAAEYMATNTATETKVEVPQDAPMVESVRLAAIKTLESQAQLAAAQQANMPVFGDEVAPASSTRSTEASPVPAARKPVLESLPPPPVEEKPAETTTAETPR